MKSISHFAMLFATIILIGFAPVKQSWSADDNASVAQVYLEFDPATGQFKSVPATPDNSPDGAMVMSGNHATPAQTAAPADASAQQNTAASAPASAAPATVDNTATAEGSTSPVLIGAIVAVVVIGGLFMTLRKKTA